MEKIEQLHEKAMEITDLAIVAKLNHDYETAKRHFAEAFTFEKQAALLLINEYLEEPTRSILFRSAAALAIDADLYDEAKKMIGFGLSGDLPEEISDELQTLLEKITFYRHLETKGITLGRRAFQVALVGKDASDGRASSEIFINEITNISAVLNRTLDRKSGKPYRSAGISSLAKSYPIYVEALREGSFAFTIRVGTPSNQDYLPGLPDLPEEAISEMLDCIELLENQCEEDLKKRIPDPAYFTHFVTHMAKIAPDGENLSGIAFTSESNGTDRKIAFRRNQESINQIPFLDSDQNNILFDSEANNVTLRGKLLFADALTEDITKGVIKLKEENGKTHYIHVPLGMEELIPSLWSKNVIAFGSQRTDGKKKYIDLKRIEPVSSNE